MLKHANINNLTSHVHDYCNIIIIFFFRSLIFKAFVYVRHQDVVLATKFLTVFHESYFLFPVSFL